MRQTLKDRLELMAAQLERSKKECELLIKEIEETQTPQPKRESVTRKKTRSKLFQTRPRS